MLERDRLQSHKRQLCSRLRHKILCTSPDGKASPRHAASAGGPDWNPSSCCRFKRILIGWSQEPASLHQFGTQIAHASPEPLAQERAQRCPVFVANFRGNRFNIEPAAVKKGLRAFDAQVLEPGKR
ncbi:hypothetical protein P3T16_000665 [Paraburkholderia sp. GAS42]|jgi:hypothetical protein